MSSVAIADPRIERVINNQRVQAGWSRGVRFCWTVRDPHPDPRRGENAPVVVAEFTLADPASIMGRLDSEIRQVSFDPRPPDPTRDEIERLRASGFAALADERTKAHKTADDPPGLFWLGPVFLDVRAGLAFDVVRDCLRRHINGDFGSRGVLADVSLNDDMLYAPEFFDVSVRNAVALRSGHGVIISEYPIYDPADVNVAERWRRRLPGLRVVTMLGQKTVAWSDTSSMTIG